LLERFGLEADQNLRQIDAVLRHLVAAGKHVFFEASHFFSGYSQDASYALATLLVAHQAGAEALILADSDATSSQTQVYDATKATVDSLAAAGIETVIGIHGHGGVGPVATSSLEAVRAGAQLVLGGFGLLASPVWSNSQGSPGQPDAFGHIGGSARTDGTGHPGSLGHPGIPGQPTGNIQPVGEAAGLRDGSGQASPTASLPPSKTADFSKRIAELGLALPGDAPSQKSLLHVIRMREAQGYDYHQADASLALLLRANFGAAAVFEQESFRVIDELRADGRVRSEATIKLVLGGWRHVVTAEGDTALDALDAALRTALKPNYPQVDKLMLTGRELLHLDAANNSANNVGGSAASATANVAAAGAGAANNPAAIGQAGNSAVNVAAASSAAAGAGAANGVAPACRVILRMSDGRSEWGAIGIGSSPTQAAWEALVDAVSFGLLKN
jgi:2-isopropylmalate synthase